MVSRFFSTSALLASMMLPSLCTRAQDVMAQIESQVASVVKHSTDSVVTIEDLRGIELNDAWRESMSNRPRGLRHRMTDALNRLSDADIQIAVLKSAVKSGTVLTEAVKSRAAIVVELDGLRADIGKSTDASRMRVDIESAHLKWLTDKRTRLEDEITQLTKTLKPTSSRLAPLLATRTAINTQVTESQAALVGDQQKLGADPIMHTEIPKAGSGFCIGDGLIVTTADVLEGMSEPIVVTTDGSRIRTRVVGVDNETNIGLLHLNADLNMPGLILADSNTVSIGNFAICIGNQSGNQNAASLNTISGVRSDGMFSGRRFYPSLLQVAGTIAAGNSGAPLLNSRGEVIGMVVAVPVGDWFAPFAGFPSHVGVVPPAGDSHQRDDHGTHGNGPPSSDYRAPVTNAGYAVPMSYARPILADLRSGKPAQHCWIGISVTTLVKTDYNDKTLDLKRTVTVNRVYPESPALKAGVQMGDQIITINGRPIHENVDVRIVSMLARPGDPVDIVLVRPMGQKLDTITLHAIADLRPTTFPARPTPPQPTKSQ